MVLEGRPIYLKAVAPTGGGPLHPDAVREPIYKDAEGKPRAVQVPHAKITQRIADVFRRKARIRRMIAPAGRICTCFRNGRTKVY